MIPDQIQMFIKLLFNTLVLPRAKEAFDGKVPDELFGDLAAGIFALLSGQPLTTITKGLVLATVDNIIRDYKEKLT